MTKYVVGFLFNPEKDKVILIQKNRPNWQKGLYNGVGGHIEIGETPGQAMIREFHEETGVLIMQWLEYALIKGADYEVYFFHASSKKYNKARKMTDESICIMGLYELKSNPIIFNLNWLIPMALDPHQRYSVIDCF